MPKLSSTVNETLMSQELLAAQSKLVKFIDEVIVPARKSQDNSPRNGKADLFELKGREWAEFQKKMHNKTAKGLPEFTDRKLEDLIHDAKLNEVQQKEFRSIVDDYNTARTRQHDAIETPAEALPQPTIVSAEQVKKPATATTLKDYILELAANRYVPAKEKIIRSNMQVLTPTEYKEMDDVAKAGYQPLIALKVSLNKLDALSGNMGEDCKQIISRIVKQKHSSDVADKLRMAFDALKATPEEIAKAQEIAEAQHAEIQSAKRA